MQTQEPLSATSWRKSSYSGNEDGHACVEVATDNTAGLVGVRDSKDPRGPVLAFRATAWASFVAGVKAGELPTV